MIIIYFIHSQHLVSSYFMPGPEILKKEKEEEEKEKTGRR